MGDEIVKSSEVDWADEGKEWQEHAVVRPVVS